MTTVEIKRHCVHAELITKKTTMMSISQKKNQLVCARDNLNQFFMKGVSAKHARVFHQCIRMLEALCTKHSSPKHQRSKSKIKRQLQQRKIILCARIVKKILNLMLENHYLLSVFEAEQSLRVNNECPECDLISLVWNHLRKNTQMPVARSSFQQPCPCTCITVKPRLLWDTANTLWPLVGAVKFPSGFAKQQIVPQLTIVRTPRLNDTLRFIEDFRQISTADGHANTQQQIEVQSAQYSNVREFIFTLDELVKLLFPTTDSAQTEHQLQISKRLHEVCASSSQPVHLNVMISNLIGDVSNEKRSASSDLVVVAVSVGHGSSPISIPDLYFANTDGNLPIHCSIFIPDLKLKKTIQELFFARTKFHYNSVKSIDFKSSAVTKPSKVCKPSNCNLMIKTPPNYLSLSLRREDASVDTQMCSPHPPEPHTPNGSFQAVNQENRHGDQDVDLGTHEEPKYSQLQEKDSGFFSQPSTPSLCDSDHEMPVKLNINSEVLLQQKQAQKASPSVSQHPQARGSKEGWPPQTKSFQQPAVKSNYVIKTARVKEKMKTPSPFPQRNCRPCTKATRNRLRARHRRVEPDDGGSESDEDEDDHQRQPDGAGVGGHGVGQLGPGQNEELPNQSAEDVDSHLSSELYSGHGSWEIPIPIPNDTNDCISHAVNVEALPMPVFPGTTPRGPPMVPIQCTDITVDSVLPTDQQVNVAEVKYVYIEPKTPRSLYNLLSSEPVFTKGNAQT